MSKFFKLNKNKKNKKEIKLHLIGSFFSILLTVIPFTLVIKYNFYNYIYLIIILCSIFQILIHFFCFFHLNFKSEYLNTIFLIFTIFVAFIISFGSLLIMWDVNCMNYISMLEN